MKDINNHRLKIIYIDPKILFGVLINKPDEFIGKALITNVPDDLTYYGANYSDEKQCIMLCVHSESFDKVPLGEIIPELKPVYKTQEDGNV